jgi:hypothetical protein
VLASKTGIEHFIKEDLPWLLNRDVIVIEI